MTGRPTAVALRPRILVEPLESRLLLAPLVNVGTLDDLVYSVPASAGAVIFEDDGTPGNGVSQLRSINGAFDTTPVPNPAGTLTIQRERLGDAITLNSLPDFTAGLTIGSSSAAFASVVFAGQLTLAAHKNLTTFASGTINLSSAVSDLTLSGSGGVVLSTTQNVFLSAGSSITTADGDLVVSANMQETPSSGSFIGIEISGATLQVTGTGMAMLRGRGGNHNGGLQHGIRVGPSGNLDSLINAGTEKPLSLEGTGGLSTGNENRGVYVVADSRITSSGASLNITGHGGGSATSGSNHGVSVSAAAQISAGGNGAVSVLGKGGAGAGDDNCGVLISSSGIISSNSGNVEIRGSGGGVLSSQSDHGVFVASSGKIQAGGSGSVNVQGTGGLGAGDENGVFVGSNGLITSAGGNVQVSGQGGGSGNSASNVGIYITSQGQISAGGLGALTVQGAGGDGGGDAHYGVYLSSEGNIRSNGGNAQIVGIEGDGSVAVYISNGSISSLIGRGLLTIAGDSMLFSTGAAIRAGQNTVMLRPFSAGMPINLGLAGDPIGGPLNLSAIELNCITASGLIVGDSNSGALTVAGAASSSAMANISLASGGPISISGGVIDSRGGNLNLAPGLASGVHAGKPGLDVRLGTSGTGTLSFASGGDLSLAIDGAAVDSQYQQLSVVGKVNLSGADLKLAIPNRPVFGDSFILVNNDGNDPIVGTFNGLPEGALFVADPQANVGGFAISYFGGDGNDVVITAVNMPPSFDIGSDLHVTDEDGSQAAWLWASAVSPGAPNEFAQDLRFVVTTDDDGLFAELPSIDRAGNLKFTPNANVEGLAHISVRLVDDGGTVAGGVDVSPIQTFTIRVTKLHRRHNAALALDVTGPGGTPDSLVTAADALAVINYINGFGAGEIPTTGSAGPPYVDTTGGQGDRGDDRVTGNDVLAVINHINAFGTGVPAAESEASDERVVAEAQDWLTLLASDVAAQPRRRHR